MAWKLGSQTVAALMLGALTVSRAYVGTAVAYDAAGAGAGGSISATFGALTAAGAGGIPVGGTSISSGDPSGHWQINGGYLCPTTAGDSANLGSGPYSLTLDNGQTVSVAIVANRRDCRTDAEFAAARALGSAALSGTTIHLRAGTYAAFTITSQNTDWCTIQSDSRDVTRTWGFGLTETISNRSGDAVLLGFTFTGAAFWRIRNVQIYKPTPATGDNKQQFIATFEGCNDVEVSRCEVCCDPPATYTNPNGWRLLTGLGNQNTASPSTRLRIVDNFFHDIHRACELRTRDDGEFSRNVIRDVYLSPMEFVDPYLAGWGEAQRLVRRLTIADNSVMGVFHDTTQPGADGNAPHTACPAFQVEYMEEVRYNGNIVLPVYPYSGIGGCDMDAGTVARRCEIKGNTVVCRQNSNPRIMNSVDGRIIGNTLLAPIYRGKTAYAVPYGTDGPNIYGTGGSAGGNVCSHNISHANTSGPRWGTAVVHATGWTDEKNLGLGTAQVIVTDASGIITAERAGLNALAVPAGTRDCRIQTIFRGSNAAGELSQPTDFRVYGVRADIAAYLGDWVGAWGSGYVTYPDPATQMSNPQASTINTAMEGITSAPVNTAAPAVTGTAAPGQVLTATSGTWTGSPTPTLAIQWQADGVAISGQTASTYTVQAGDAGKAIRVQVTATNSQGSASAVSNAVTVAALSAPANTAAPVASGTGAVGQVLSVTNGTWTGNPVPALSYQWERDGAPISGATASSYTVVAGDAGTGIRCRVTGTNSQGSASATSNTITISSSFTEATVNASNSRLRMAANQFDTVQRRWMLWFVCGTFSTAAGANTYIVGQGNLNGYIRRNVNGSIGAAWRNGADTAGPFIMTGGTAQAFGAEKYAALVLFDADGTSRIWACRNVSGTWTWQQVTTDGSGGAAGVLTTGSISIGANDAASPTNWYPGAFHRVASWVGDSAPPDIADAAVRALFFDTASGAVVDPSVSIASLGNPRIDKYLGAATWNAGQNEGAAGAFTTYSTNWS